MPSSFDLVAQATLPVKMVVLLLLIFSLGRLDVWPVDDLGIVIAAQGIYQLPDRPKRKELLAMGEPWRPYRTIGSELKLGSAVFLSWPL